MDVKQIVADTLRTLMGSTAAEPYVNAIDRAIDSAPPSMVYLVHRGDAQCSRYEGVHLSLEDALAAHPLPHDPPAGVKERGWKLEEDRPYKMWWNGLLADDCLMIFELPIVRSGAGAAAESLRLTL